MINKNTKTEINYLIDSLDDETKIKLNQIIDYKNTEIYNNIISNCIHCSIGNNNTFTISDSQLKKIIFE